MPLLSLALSVGLLAAVATPPEMVATYASLADSILANRRTESNLVHAILATTYGHAEATLGRIKSKLDAKQDARSEVESLATLVAQLGNEGDAAVAAVRKRLIEAGHHHNSAAEQQGIYDEGFVVVTKVIRQGLIDAAGRIGKMSLVPDKMKLETEWQAVAKLYASLPAGASH